MDSFSRIRRLVLSAGIDEAEYRNVTPEIVESNRRSVLGMSLLASVFLAVMSFLSFVDDSLSGNRWLYIVSLVFTCAIVYLAYRKGKQNATVVFVITYAFIGILLLFGIFLGTVTGPDEITATYIALLLTAPSMFTDRPYRMCLLIFGSAIFFIIMVVTQKNPITWDTDIVNSLIFSCVSAVVSTYMTNVKVRRYCLEDTIRYMAETDQLTGLKNRNSYEQRLQNASILKATSLYCVYVDVNGLHELNNTMGHEAGDRMLQYIATVMKNIFGKADTYRVGGDEYVAIGINRSEEELKEMIVSMRQAVEAAGYHAAIGMKYEVQAGLEVNQLIKQAETNMYEDKREYYQRNGIDRRR